MYRMLIFAIFFCFLANPLSEALSIYIPQYEKKEDVIY